MVTGGTTVVAQTLATSTSLPSLPPGASVIFLPPAEPLPCARTVPAPSTSCGTVVSGIVQVSEPVLVIVTIAIRLPAAPSQLVMRPVTSPAVHGPTMGGVGVGVGVGAGVAGVGDSVGDGDSTGEGDTTGETDGSGDGESPIATSLALGEASPPTPEEVRLPSQPTASTSAAAIRPAPMRPGRDERGLSGRGAPSGRRAVADTALHSSTMRSLLLLGSITRSPASFGRG